MLLKWQWPEVKEDQLLVSQFHRWAPPASPLLWIWPDLFCFVIRAFCYCMLCPRKKIWNETCEYPCVFALYMNENVEKTERKGEREFVLCPFQPSAFLCVFAPFFLFLIPSFSCCQSSLYFCHLFNFLLSLAFFLTLIFFLPLSLSALFCFHILPFVFTITCSVIY